MREFLGVNVVLNILPLYEDEAVLRMHVMCLHDAGRDSTACSCRVASLKRLSGNKSPR